jgi:hypothetical protein
MKHFFKLMLRNPGGLIGLVILTIAILVALFGPLVFPTSPWRMVQRPFLPPFTLSTVPLGTDALGATSLPGSSTARASRCWSDWSRPWWRWQSVCHSAPLPAISAAGSTMR